MKKLLFLTLLLFYSITLYSHPHVFIDVELEFLESERVRVFWTFDALESENKIYFFDDSGDGSLSSQEVENLYNEGFSNVREYNYFLNIIYDSSVYTVESISDFQAEFGEDQLLTVSFSIDLPHWSDRLEISHFDTSYFIEFSGVETTIITPPANYYHTTVRDSENPIYYDPQAGRTVVLDTSKPQKGWLKAYPTVTTISSTPIESHSSYRLNLSDEIRKRQGKIYRRLSTTLIDFQKSPNSGVILTIVLLAFIYGVVHGLGPGHRKIVISSYILTQKRLTYLKAVGISITSALIHSASGIFIILILGSLYTRINPSYIDNISNSLGLSSYISILVLTLLLIVIKVVKVVRKRESRDIKALGLGVIYLSSIIPCPGAITIMLYAFSVNMISLGIISVFAMSLGIGATLTLVSILTLKGRNTFNIGRKGLFFEWFGLSILLIFSLFMITANLPGGF